MKCLVSVTIRACRFYSYVHHIGQLNFTIIQHLNSQFCFNKPQSLHFIYLIARLTVANRIQTRVMLQAGHSHFQLFGNVSIACVHSIQTESAVTLVHCFCEPLTDLCGQSVTSLWHDFPRPLRPLLSTKGLWVVVCLEKQTRIQILFYSNIGLFTTTYVPKVEYRYYIQCR